MQFQLSTDQYSAPAECPFPDPVRRAEYLRGHRSGWLAFAGGIRTELTEDGYQRGTLAGLASVRPAGGTEAELAGFDAGFAAANALHLEQVLRAGAQQQRPEGEWRSPVGAPDRLDLIVTGKDGSVRLMVVVAGRLDPADRRTAAVLEAKLRNYCRYIKHPAFADEFGPPTPDRVKLALRSNCEVPEPYIRLLARVAREEGVPAGLEVRYE
jgi:hypothetical protein